MNNESIYNQWNSLSVTEKDNWFGDKFDPNLEPAMLTTSVSKLAVEHKRFFSSEFQDASTTAQWEEMLKSWISYRKKNYA